MIVRKTSMKNAKMIGNIGDILLILGSIVYVYALLTMQTPLLTAVISVIYITAVVLKLIHFVSTRDERRAAKEAEKGKAA